MLSNLLKTRVVLLAALLFGGAIVFAGCASSGAGGTARSGANDPTLDKPVAPPSATMVVYGLSCPLCATNIDQTLADIPGVTGVATDLSNGRISVSVSADNPPTRRQLVKAVQDSGFTFKEFLAAETAAAQ